MACQRHSQQQLLEVDISEWEAPPAELSVELEHTPQIGDPDRTPDGSNSLMWFCTLTSAQEAERMAQLCLSPSCSLRDEKPDWEAHAACDFWD